MTDRIDRAAKFLAGIDAEEMISAEAQMAVAISNEARRRSIISRAMMAHGFTREEAIALLASELSSPTFNAYWGNI